MNSTELILQTNTNPSYMMGFYSPEECLDRLISIHSLHVHVTHPDISICSYLNYNIAMNPYYFHKSGKMNLLHFQDEPFMMKVNHKIMFIIELKKIDCSFEEIKDNLSATRCEITWKYEDEPYYKYFVICMHEPIIYDLAFNKCIYFEYKYKTILFSSLPILKENLSIYDDEKCINIDENIQIQRVSPYCIIILPPLIDHYSYNIFYRIIENEHVYYMFI